MRMLPQYSPPLAAVVCIASLSIVIKSPAAIAVVVSTGAVAAVSDDFSAVSIVILLKWSYCCARLN